MDAEDDSQATQQATQTALDPRRLGQQNSGFSDEDIADIVCLLYPNTESASREIQRLARDPGYTQHITGMYSAEAIESDESFEDDAESFGKKRGVGDHAIVLKLSSAVKSPHLGFTFGRNAPRCDICFVTDPHRRLSNVHFRIYVNMHGTVMLEDQSTNGTIVDDILLKKKDTKNQPTMRMLSSGSTIKIYMHENARDLAFIVRIPRREGDLEQAWENNLRSYLRKNQAQSDDLERTIGPGPGGHVNLFPPPFQKVARAEALETTQDASEHVSREWRGDRKYSRVGQIGKGAFATVYKVTSKYDGTPYAAKELDKRKFMKNGVLDQKVENEMKIMQRVQHDNIVRYIDHFDHGAHQFFIIMEYIPGGDLGKLIQDKGAINEPFVKVMARQLISALGYLHTNRITHRDVKPDNILVYSTHPELVVKLTDFGLSKMIDTEQTFLKTFCGTLLYCAPEVYSEFTTYDEQGRRNRQKPQQPATRERYDHAVDVWSLGGVLFYALTGSPPFPAKNGISYTELLHQIMTKPLDLRPLMQAGISSEGINFLSRMIDRRPETRATIEELQSHSWLTGLKAVNPAESFDEISDDGLEQGASQLSLLDRDPESMYRSNVGPSELLEPEPDLSMEEDDKENYTFGQPVRPQLWGEVNGSAMGSSGAIPENRLNIPMSSGQLDGTEIFDEDEIHDSFESEETFKPRPISHRPRGELAPNAAGTNGGSKSAASDIGSQSLGGASVILENLHMKSLAPSDSHLRANVSDVNASKRKPAYDTSDEFDSPGSSLKPSFKRLKSKTDDIPVTDDDENEKTLYASVPKMVKSDSGRDIDYPVHKAIFWDDSDKSTWHLEYPEMTHLQHAAFRTAAKKRNEEFSPGKSPLWDLAMKCFPPSGKVPDVHHSNFTDARPTLLRRDSRSLREDALLDLPPTAPPPRTEDDVISLPDTLPPDSQVPPPAEAVAPTRKVVGRLTSVRMSLVPNIAINLVDPVLSWGRAPDNTIVYHDTQESRIPKYALRILLWREGYTASSSEFRPWDPRRSLSSTTMRASPEPDSFSFYVSTKATNGIHVNLNPLPSNEAKNAKAPSRHWMKLYHGDSLMFWGTHDVNNQVKVTFECLWGGSCAERPADEPPTCVPETVARKLDSTWFKAEKTLHHERTQARANLDQQLRMKEMAREQELSRQFEKKRANAVQWMALRSSRRSSPDSASIVLGRTLPHLRQDSPSGLAQSS